MAMLDIKTVLKELKGKDENGKMSLLSKTDLQEVRSRFQDYAFAYSKKDGGHTACSGCGGLLERIGKKHGDAILCPRCRKYVKVYEEWRGHKHLHDSAVIYIWKRSRTDPQTILAKVIYAEKSYGYSFAAAEDAPLRARVDAVYQFGPKGAKMYRKGYGSEVFSANASSVTPEENKHGYRCGASHAGFWDAVNGTRLGKTAKGIGVRFGTEDRSGMHPVLAMAEAARKPYLEYVLAQGQAPLAREIARGIFGVKKRAAKSMPELLGLTEGQWYEVRRGGLMLNYRWLNALYDLQRAGNMTITLKEAWTAVEQNSSMHRSRLADNANILLGRCTPKLRRKAVRRAGLSCDLPEWLDYWGQLRELHEDMADARILLPKDMNAMHQRMTERINAAAEQRKKEMDAMLMQEHAKRMEALKKKYTFEACGLILRPFETADEVIAEGTKQHICIGSYTQRYMEGKTILCALRRAEAPEEPWRAIEFSATTGKMVQDRGAYNDRGLGEGNLRNGVDGWLKRFWAAFEARDQESKRERVGITV